MIYFGHVITLFGNAKTPLLNIPSQVLPRFVQQWMTSPCSIQSLFHGQLGSQLLKRGTTKRMPHACLCQWAGMFAAMNYSLKSVMINGSTPVSWAASFKHLGAMDSLTAIIFCMSSARLPGSDQIRACVQRVLRKTSTKRLLLLLPS